MKYAYIMPNDFINGESVCVSLWVQGCPHRCAGCHNPEQWDFEGGEEYTPKVTNYIVDTLIPANGIIRNFSILGGEPLCKENVSEVSRIVTDIRIKYNDDLKIFIWTGYTLEQLKDMGSYHIDVVLSNIDYLIDGPFIEAQRDITLKLRGSSNQHIYKRTIGTNYELVE